MKHQLSVCTTLSVVLLLSINVSMGKVLRHAQSSVGESKGSCRSTRDMPSDEERDATVAGYNNFIDGEIVGKEMIFPIPGTAFIEIVPPVNYDDEMPRQGLEWKYMYPKVLQGWKVHYQPPHRQIQLAMKTAVETLLRLKANFKIVGKVLREDGDAEKRDGYVWKTFSDPPIDGESENNLFGKMITIYGYKYDDVLEPDVTKLSEIVVELNDALKKAGINDQSNVPPPDCRLNGDFLSGFSMRYGVHKSGYTHLDNQMYKIIQKHDGSFVCMCADRYPAEDELSSPKRKVGEEYECECPTYTRSRHREGDVRTHIYEDDIRKATRAIEKRECTCRPDWVTWNAGDLEPRCPKKGSILRGHEDSIIL